MIELEEPNFWDMTFGRGAWRTFGKDNQYSYYRWYLTKPKDGNKPNVNSHYFSVHMGVMAIQKLLIFHGFDQPITGVYGLRTKRNVKKFQAQAGITAEGVAGPQTCKALVKPVVNEYALEREINPAIVGAFASLESGWDPGAQGVSHPPDLGFFQCNVEDTEVTYEEAFDPFIAADIATRRYQQAWNKYKGKGTDLRQSCSIAQHNSPLWADQWFAAGEPPNSTIEKYVSLVLGYVPSW